MVNAKKLGLLGRCLLGAVAGLAAGGCYEELTRYQAVNAKDYKQATAINALADMIGAEENYQRDLDIAREGRSEVKSYIIYENGDYVTVLPNRKNKPSKDKKWEIVYENGDYVTVLH